MNEPTAIDRLAKLREPFPPNQVSKRPKPTKSQTDAVRNDLKTGIRCKICGAWHHPDVIHLDYVGHAALTDRLLDTDPSWTWEPMALRDGLPAFDNTGGLWIKLTICGVTRLGYGHAAPKPNQDPGAREKEVIGDALRNAAMRFGAALDLWHKGDLHAAASASDGQDDAPPPHHQQSARAAVAHVQAPASGIKRLTSARAKEIGLDKQLKDAIYGCTTIAELDAWEAAFERHTAQCPLSWLDSIKNEVIICREQMEQAEPDERTRADLEEFDRAFRGTVGSRMEADTSND